MELISFHNLKQAFTDRELYFDVSGKVFNSSKIGLIGQNGTGKTTLVKILIKELKPDAGEIKSFVDRIGYIPQDVDSELKTGDISIQNFAISLSPSISKEYTKLIAAERKLESDNHAYLNALGDFQEVGGYEILNEIQVLLKKAGFNDLYLDKNMKELSEGQKRLVYLIGTLAGRPQMLILDEPTNHVDYELKTKYIELIKSFNGPVLVISHDREVLSEACNTIWELEDGILQKYKGNWDTYEAEHGKRVLNAVRNFKSITAEIARQNELLIMYQDRAKHSPSPLWSTKISQTKRRIERLEDELPAIEPKVEKAAVRETIKYEGKSSEFMVRIKDLTIYTDDEILVNDFNLEFKKGEKVGLVGGNGSGKSTIIKTILGQCDYAKSEGEIKLSPSAKIGYFNQKLQFANDKVSLYKHIEKEFGAQRHQVYALMKKYLFDKSFEDTWIRDLSGGEKNRLHLMKLIEGNFNWLILDEPTNHLDLYQIEALEEMLKNFNGSLLLISHDRYFREHIVEREVNLGYRKII